MDNQGDLDKFAFTDDACLRIIQSLLAEYEKKFVTKGNLTGLVWEEGRKKPFLALVGDWAADKTKLRDFLREFAKVLHMISDEKPKYDDGISIREEKGDLVIRFQIINRENRSYNNTGQEQSQIEVRVPAGEWLAAGSV